MRILVAEDDVKTAEFIRRGLEELGHHVVTVDNGADAVRMLVADSFDVSILDRMLPGIDGLTVTRRVRGAEIDVPVLLLTALGRIQDRVDGLDAGADDYLVKPFAFSELAARVQALGRRKPTLTEPEVTRLGFGEITMDLLKRRVFRAGERVLLQPREFRILEELMRSGRKVMTRTMLLERVWNYHFDPHTNIVETHISRLRSRLNVNGQPDAIETVRGVGYCMADHG